MRSQRCSGGAGQPRLLQRAEGVARPRVHIVCGHRVAFGERDDDGVYLTFDTTHVDGAEQVRLYGTLEAVLAP